MKNTNSYCNKGETMVNFTRKPRYGYEDLLEIIRLLRSPEGCPWDKVQTHASIRRGLLEEAYEAAEAIDLDNAGLLQEELGDVMMQVVFHADIEKDRGRFTMDDVVDGVVKKLLYRHPHVFGSAHEDSPESVLISWDQLKRAEKLQKKAADAGFDWPDISGALSKLEEEVRELRQAVETGRGVEEELGDVLFAAVKVGRFAGIDPEEAVAGTCEKFIHRFRAVEDGAREQGRTLEDMPLEEMTRLWNRAK